MPSSSPRADDTRAGRRSCSTPRSTGWSTLSRTSVPTFAPNCVTGRSRSTTCPTASTSTAAWKGNTGATSSRTPTARWTVAAQRATQPRPSTTVGGPTLAPCRAYTGVIVALATTAAVLSGSTVGAAPPGDVRTGATARAAPGRSRDGVELTLADGDQLPHLDVATTYRTVWGKRYDAATGYLGRAPAVVLRARRTSTCGDVDARTAERRGGRDRQVRPQLLRGRSGADLLPRALVARHRHLVVVRAARVRPTRSPASPPTASTRCGRSTAATSRAPRPASRRTRSTAEGEEYTVTATITDQAQVSYLSADRAVGGAPSSCSPAPGTPSRPARSSRSPARARTATSPTSTPTPPWFGDFERPRLPSRHLAARRRITVGRDRGGAGHRSWAGLRRRGVWTPGSSRLPASPCTPSGPVGVGTIRAQAYDRSTQTWGATEVVHEAGEQRCTVG